MRAGQTGWRKRLAGCWSVAAVLGLGLGCGLAQEGTTLHGHGQEGPVLDRRRQQSSESPAALNEPGERWRRWRRAGFTLYANSPEDAALVPQLLEAIEEARRELEGQWGLQLPAQFAVHVHPDLVSFQAASGMPWYVAGVARSPEAAIHLQRLRVLQERGGLRRTVRHELFHLAQPLDWPRWLAEGAAMVFAGESPAAAPLAGVSERQLDSLLARPKDRQTLLRAQATAYHRALASPELRTAGRE